MSKRQGKTKDKDGRARSMKRLPVLGGLALVASLISPLPAQGATYTVTNTMDGPGPPAGSLRAAVQAANGAPGTNDTIVFASGLSGTIMLTGTITLNDSKGLTIAGPGARQLTIDGNGDEIFAVNAPATLSGLTLTGAGTGPPIYSASSSVTLEHMTVSGNSVTNGAGGVEVDDGALTIDTSTIADNRAPHGAGVFQLQDSTLTVRNSTIAGNTATTGNGGGIYLAGASGHPDTASIVASTIAGNHAPSGKGGGLWASDSSVSMQDSIISGDTAPSNPDVYNAFTSPDGSYLSAQFSLIQNESGVPIDNPVGDIVGLDPLLGPLRDNGGPTDTMKPALNSPVIDQGQAFGLTSDQRGLLRPVDIGGVPNSTAAGADGSDMGAVELQFADFPPVVTSLSPSSGTAGTSVVVSGQFLTGATQVLFGSTPASGFAVDSDKQIRAIAPAGAGTVDVRVVTPGGESAVVAGDPFTYTPPAPHVPAVTCSLNLASIRARVRAAVSARKHSGTRKPPSTVKAPTTASVSVKCDQDASVSVTGTIHATIKRKVRHRHRRRKIHRLITLPVVSGSVQAGVPQTLTIPLPTAAQSAFKQRGKRSATLTVKASNAKGTTIRQTTIAKL